MCLILFDIYIAKSFVSECGDEKFPMPKELLNPVSDSPKKPQRFRPSRHPAMASYLRKRLATALIVALVRLEVVVHPSVLLERRFLGKTLFAQLAETMA